MQGECRKLGTLQNLGQQIVDAADAYRTKDSRDVAECPIRHMKGAAKDGIFIGKLSTNQAYYVQGWTRWPLSAGYSLTLITTELYTLPGARINWCGTPAGI